MDKKKEVGLRLKQLREAKGWSQRELAKACGWASSSRVGNYEIGARSISLEDADTLASALGVRAMDLLFNTLDLANVQKAEPNNRAFFNEFPVISAVTAGAWSEAVEPYELHEIDEYMSTTEKASECSFWLKVIGDSMTSPSGISFPDGMYILVDPEIEPINQSFVVAKLKSINEATFKQLVIDAGQKFLKPLNPDFRQISINGDCKIVGVVIDAKWKLR